MRFYKTVFTLAIATVMFGAFAQQTTQEKADETLKQQQKNAQAMVNKYGRDVESLIPASHQTKEKGHTQESFIDKSARTLKGIEERLDGKGMLDGVGVNEDSNEQHSQKRLPEGFMDDQRAKLNAYTKKLKKDGMLEGFDEASIAKKTQRFKDAAQLLANQSQDGMVQSLQRDLGLDLSPKQKQAFNAEQLVEPTRLKAIFVSFNMPTSAMKQVLELAVQQGAQVFLKGMHPDDSGIHDTIRRLRFIGRDLKINPDVRFKPRYFQDYNITTAPTILIRNDKGVTYASGITNIDWLEGKADKGNSKGYLGSYGDTVAVTEKDIRQEFKDRMAGMNLEGKPQQIVNKYWSKKTFQDLPPAQKNETWFIDPTVRANEDIVNPRGDQLATKGEVLNPISEMPVPLTLFIFDPTDNTQLEWVANNHRDGEGQTMLIFSKLDKSRGWKHLEALRTYFDRELYELPKEMVERFKLTHLPVKVTTDMQRKLMKVEQYRTATEGNK